MIKRTLYSYAGALLVPLLLMPFAAMFTMGGHSLMYIVILGSPLGLILGTIYYDTKNSYDYKSKSVRLGISIAATIVVMYFIFTNTALRNMNNGWLVIPVICPILVAPISGMLLKK